MSCKFDGIVTYQRLNLQLTSTQMRFFYRKTLVVLLGATGVNVFLAQLRGCGIVLTVRECLIYLDNDVLIASILLYWYQCK